MRSGWKGAKQTRDESSDFAPTLKFESGETVVIRFLEDEPYASYHQHWVERQGKRSFVCPEDRNDPKSPRCPLCDVGAERRAQYSFNVVVLEGDSRPVIKSWDVGVRLLKKLETINADKKIGPLTATYFAVTKTGKGTQSDTTPVPVKERDLWDDYEVEPLTEKEFDSLYRKRFDASIVQVPSMQTLRELAKDMTKYDG